MPGAEPLSVIIQAGGKSSRMGQDKALLPFLGEPLIKRVLDRLARLPGEVMVTTNQPEGYRFLGIPLVADLLPERGALGGLYTALSAAHYPLVAVVACDMPFANPAVLDAQRKLLADPEIDAVKFDAVIPQTEKGQEPFHAVYRREACLPAIHSALQAGKWRADAWFDQVRLRYFRPEEILPLDPHRLAFWNVNTPEELRRAEEMALTIPSL